MIQYVGFGIISLLSFGWGLEQSVALKKKNKRLREIVAFVKHIREEINCFARPIGEILSSYDDDIVSANADNIIFLKKQSSTNAYLFDDAKKVLDAFQEKIGEGTKEESLKLCDYTISELEAIAERHEAEYVSKSRLWKTLPLLASLSLTILLL